MTTPSAGRIGLAAVRAETGIGGPVGLGDAAVRSLAGVSSGPISLSNLYGKTGTPGGAIEVSSMGDTSSGDPTGFAFVASAFPSVTASLGKPPYSYLWTIATQNGNGFTLSDMDQSVVEVSHTIGRYGYVGGCTLTCVVGDDGGQQKTVTGIRADFDYQQLFES